MSSADAPPGCPEGDSHSASATGPLLAVLPCGVTYNLDVHRPVGLRSKRRLSKAGSFGEVNSLFSNILTSTDSVPRISRWISPNSMIPRDRTSSERGICPEKGPMHLRTPPNIQ